MYSGREFLQKSPLLNSISWQAEIRENPELEISRHFYGKFSIQFGSTLLGIHSYAEHGKQGPAKFIEKCCTVMSHIEEFCEVLQDKSLTVCNVVQLNEADTPYSGSIYYNQNIKEVGKSICVFEFASCKHKIRLHAHELDGGRLELMSILITIHKNVKALVEATKLVEAQLGFGETT